MKFFTLYALSAGIVTLSLMYSYKTTDDNKQSVSSASFVASQQNKEAYKKNAFKVINKTFKENNVSTVSDVVTKALAFKALLTSTQQSTLQQTFTNALAQNWSNLPCGSMCRNGIQFSTLTSEQLTSALAVIAAAAGNTTNEGYDEFMQIRTADSVLGVLSASNTYSNGIYFISFLNAPSATGAWMLQYGGIIMQLISPSMVVM